MTAGCWSTASLLARLAVVVALLAGLSPPAGATTIRVISRDQAGEGFNDPTPATPVGGNAGTTIGEQRRIALEYAAGIWAAQVVSPVEIRISATFDPLSCNASSTTLGTAGPVSVFRDFAGAPRPGTYYPSALADRLAGTDIAPDEDDIDASFNSVFGTTCPFPAGWYYGLDGLTPGEDSDFVTVALHELGHGLGFITLFDVDTGARFQGRNDVFMFFLVNANTGKHLDAMNNAERRSAARATRALRWDGPQVVAASDIVATGVDALGRVEMYAPPFALAGSSVSHWSDVVAPLELMSPFFEAPLHEVGMATAVLADIGWELAASDCPGDCGGDGAVSIDELVRAVRIALGEAAGDTCAAVDTDGDGVVSIAELIAAVSRALGGCAGG